MQSIFSILGTPVKVKPGFFANLLALWVGMLWQVDRKQPATKFWNVVNSRRSFFLDKSVSI
jgi:hypothetical protein